MSQSPLTDQASAAAGHGRGQAARLLVFAAVAAGALVVSLGPIADGDIYWHLAAGREIVRRGSLLRVDPFTVSAAGRPWIDVHWLFQLGAFGVYSAAGFFGLALAKAVLVAGGAMVLVRTAERAGGAARNLCAVAVLGGLLLDRHLVPMRPAILTMVFLALFLMGLERMRAGAARVRWPWVLLPLLQIVWCNCQGLAPLGPLLVAMYLVSAWLSSRGFRRWPCEREAASSVRPFAVLLLLCGMASFVTPYGIEAVVLPVRLLARITPGQANIFSHAVAENIPPFVLERTAPELVWHFKWVLLLLALLIALARPRFRLAHLLVLATFLALALMANRNLPLFYWLAAPIAAMALAPGLQRLATRLRRPVSASLGRTLVVLFLGGEVALAVVLRWHEPAAGSPTPFHFPVASAQRLARLRVAGPVFAAEQHGGYLHFTVPSLRPYIDTRLVLHTGEEYANYLALFDEPRRFDALAAAQGFRAVVLTTTYPDRYLGLIWYLYRSPDWRLAYTDGYEVLFLREGPSLALGERQVVDAILGDLAGRFAQGSELAAAARLNLARLLVVLAETQQAHYVLAGLGSRSAAELRARAYFVAGEPAAAEALARILLLQEPRDLRSLVLLAELAAARGDGDQAAERLRQALAIDPYDAEARSLAERLGRR
jgi:hypothetical protein